MGKGRRPLSSNVHAARGHAGKRKHKTNPQPTRIGADAPDSLDSFGRPIWAARAPEMAKLGSLNVLSVEGAAELCNALGHARHYRGLAAKSLERAAAAKSEEQRLAHEDRARILDDAGSKLLLRAQGLMIEYGWTPASIGKIHGPREEPANPTHTKWANRLQAEDDE